jgi:hypothetical protein
LHLRIAQILFLRLDIMTKSFTCSDAGLIVIGLLLQKMMRIF